MTTPMQLSMAVLRIPDQVTQEALAASQEASGEPARERGGFPDRGFHVGRGPDVDWALPDPGRRLSKLHFSVVFRDNTYLVEDHSKNGTFLNDEDEPIGTVLARPVRHGDRLRLGGYEIEVQLTAPAPREVPAPAGMGGATEPPGATSDSDEITIAKRPGEAAPSHPDPGQQANDAVPNGTGEAGQALDAFFAAAGLPDTRPQNLVNAMHGLGLAFRVTVLGLRGVMKAHSAALRDFSLEPAAIASREGNPLKASISDDAALKALLLAQRQTDDGPVAAIEETLQELSSHQYAVMAALQTTILALLDELKPGKIAAEAGDPANGARAWDAFEVRHETVARAMEEEPVRFLGPAFVEAYKQAMALIRSANR